MGMVLLGVGGLIRGVVLGCLAGVCAGGDGGIVFARLWFTLSGVALVTTLIFGVVFRDETQDRGEPTGREPSS